MKKDRWKQYVLWILVSEAIGIVSGLVSMDGMKAYAQNAIQPSFAPSDNVFPIVWTILYALMGIGMARVQLYGSIPGKASAGKLFIMQLVINFLWPLIFFNAQAYGLALVFLIVLWIFVAAMIDSFRGEDRLAGNLQIPYLLWLSFAALLNQQVWQLNR